MTPEAVVEQPRRRIMSPTWYRAGKPSQQIKCVLRSVEPNWWTQTRDCWGGLDGRDRAEDGPQGGGEQEQAGTQAHHGGSSAVSFIDSRVAQ